MAQIGDKEVLTAPEVTPAPFSDTPDPKPPHHDIGEIIDEIANATSSAKSRLHSDEHHEGDDDDVLHKVINKRQDTVTHTHTDISTFTRTWTVTQDQMTETSTVTETTAIATQTVLTTVTLSAAALGNGSQNIGNTVCIVEWITLVYFISMLSRLLRNLH